MKAENHGDAVKRMNKVLASDEVADVINRAALAMGVSASQARDAIEGFARLSLEKQRQDTLKDLAVALDRINS